MSEKEMNELTEKLRQKEAIKKEKENSQQNASVNKTPKNEGEITIQDLKDKKYGREDSKSGYTTSTYETALLKAIRKYDVIANELLGKYDENGEYYISTEILTELASLKKIVGVTNEFGTEVRAPYKDGRTFNFLLKIGSEDPQTHTAESVLYLLETVNKVNGYIQNIISTPVATYTYKYDEYYKNYCYRALHIVSNEGADDDGALKPDDALFIDARYRYLAAVKKASKDQYLLLEESFLNSRIQILNEIPQGALALSEFNKKRNALEKYFINNPRNKYRALNELLTSILEAYFDELENDPAYKISMQVLAVKYLNKVAKISEEIKETEDYKKAKESVQKVNTAPTAAPSGGGGAAAGTVKIGGKKITAKKPAKAKAKSASKGSKGSKPAKKKPAKKDNGKAKKDAKKPAGGGGGTKKEQIKTIVKPPENLDKTFKSGEFKKNQPTSTSEKASTRVNSPSL